MFVALEKNDYIATLRISRPEAMNALNHSVIQEMNSCIEEVVADKDIRVVIFTGTNNFAAGADIKAMIELNPEQANKFSFADTFKRIYNIKVPTIAAIEGYALGGGLELAITCDLRIASQKAKMGFPETGLGIMPGAGGTILAPILVGPSKAMELIFFGSIINANEAFNMGLVNKVVDEGKAYGEALKWALKIANGAPIALNMAKETIRKGWNQPTYEKGLAIEGENWSKLFSTRDQKEGMLAFLNKRTPKFTGR